MKKIIYVFLILFIVSACFGETWELENKRMLIGIERNENKMVRINNILDKKNDVNFIVDTLQYSSLWNIAVKKDKDYTGKEIILSTMDTDDFSCNIKGTNAILTWKNVKKDEMASGFDVTVTCEMIENSSYWDIKVSPNNEYGIFYVKFPIVTDLDAKEGDLLIYPCGAEGFPVTKFDNPNGFNTHLGHKETDPSYFLKTVGSINPMQLRYESLTKDNSTLYMCFEDENFLMKTFHTSMYTPNHIDFDVFNYPEKMNIANTPYEMGYKFNLSVMDGDWYDAAKRYRNWCIKTNSPAFKRGTIDKREDIPQWLKDNVCWTRWHGDTYGFDPAAGLDSILRMKETMDVNMACHVYGWSKYDYDTHYPNWLPAKDYFGDYVDKLHEKGIKVMPYTNGKLVDMNLSPYYKEYGKNMLALDENGEPYRESWSKELGADNAVGCIGSPYYDILMKESIDIMSQYKVDAWYMDQIAGSDQKFCYTEGHNHPIGGGGNYHVQLYTKYINELKKKLSKIKGDVVPFASEDIGEALPFDIFLRVNHTMAENMDYPIGDLVFSGYIVSIGNQADSAELSPKTDGTGAMNREAVAFVNGIQPGWNEGGDSEFDTFPLLKTYFKNMVKAREAGLKYFNFGELVRKVNITSPIPTKNLKWTHYAGVEAFDFPVVKTGSFLYKGEVCIVFTNIANEEVNVEWSADYKDLQLKKKGLYTISEMYPNQKQISNNKKIGGKFIIKPLETKFFVVK